MNTFKAGDIVKIKREWQDENEKGLNLTYTLTDGWNDKIDVDEEQRGYAVCNELFKDWAIRPSELLRSKIIDKILLSVGE